MKNPNTDCKRIMLFIEKILMWAYIGAVLGGSVIE